MAKKDDRKRKQLESEQMPTSDGFASDAVADAGGGSVNSRLRATNTNGRITGLRNSDDLNADYAGGDVPVGGGVGVSQTPVDGTQKIPVEIPDGSTVVTMQDGNKGLQSPDGNLYVPNAEEYNVPGVGAKPVMPMNTANAISPVAGSYEQVGNTPAPKYSVVNGKLELASGPSAEEQAQADAERESELRGRTPVDNTQGVNTQGEYWKAQPKEEEVKAQPSQTENGNTLGKGYADYLLKQNAGQNSSLMYGNNPEDIPSTPEKNEENERQRRIEEAMKGDYSDSSKMLEAYAKSLISPEEEERRARRAYAATGWGHLGNIFAGFAGLANTKKGSPAIALADVPDPKVYEWRNKVSANRLAYDKMKIQEDNRRSQEYWRQKNFDEKMRMNDARMETFKSQNNYRDAMAEYTKAKEGLDELKKEWYTIRNQAIANNDARQERIANARIKEIESRQEANEKLAYKRAVEAENEANGLNANGTPKGGGRGTGTAGHAVVGGEEFDNPKKYNAGEVKSKVLSLARKYNIPTTKPKGRSTIQRENRSYEEIAAGVVANSGARKELEDFFSGGSGNGGNTGNGGNAKKPLPGASKPANGKKKLPGK